MTPGPGARVERSLRHGLWQGLWYGNGRLAACLAPLGWLYGAGALARRALYRAGLARVERLDVPVVVIGNISVGGTGKTPLVIWTVRRLRELGYRPGVVSRGYGVRGRARGPRLVRADSDPLEVGDEPVVIARRSGCPVVVDARRARGARRLVAEAGCDVVVSDDGLQHLALGRDVEIAVVDGERRHGNGRCLPAGPLREPVSRLASVDMVVANGAAAPGEIPMRLVAGAAREVRGERAERPLESFAPGPVHAVCAIGNPRRFFAELERHGLRVVAHPFPDHHVYAPAEIAFGDDLPVLMTEKDAVKCARFAGPEHWFVPVAAEPDPELARRLERRLAAWPRAGEKRDTGR